MVPENPNRSPKSGKRLRSKVACNTQEEGEEIEESLDNTNRNAKRKRRKRRRTQNPTSSPFYSSPNFLPPPPSSSSSSSSPAMVLVSGLPEGCSVMSLKSRFEMYGPISRIRIDGCEGFVTYRSREAAVSASFDHITVHSQKVRVHPLSDPQAETRKASSKLLRSEIPLSKHGRSNKKLSSSSPISPSASSMPSRKIIAYDDLL